MFFQSYEKSPMRYENLIGTSFSIWLNQQFYNASKFINALLAIKLTSARCWFSLVLFRRLSFYIKVFRFLVVVLKSDMVKHELRVTSWKLKSTSWNFKSTSWNSKVQVQIKSTSCEFQSTSYEFQSTSSRIIKNSLKTQVNSPKIINSKLFDISWGFWW